MRPGTISEVCSNQPADASGAATTPATSDRARIVSADVDTVRAKIARAPDDVDEFNADIVSTGRSLDSGLPPVSIAPVPEAWIGQRDIWTIPGKIAERYKFSIQEDADCPESPVIAGPS
jgi:hypothetical protein